MKEKACASETSVQIKVAQQHFASIQVNPLPFRTVVRQVFEQNYKT